MNGDKYWPKERVIGDTKREHAAGLGELRLEVTTTVSQDAWKVN